MTRGTRKHGAVTALALAGAFAGSLFVGSTGANATAIFTPGNNPQPDDLNYDGVLGDLAPADWMGRIDQVLVQGTRIMREVAMYHRASRTLILVDLIENFTDATPNTGGALKFWFKYVLRMWGIPGPRPNTGWGGTTGSRRRSRFGAYWRGTFGRSYCPTAT